MHYLAMSFVSSFQKMANADRDHVAIDMEEMLANAQPLFTTECCIYEVPYEIRRLNEDAYTPHLVSIGPLHHGDPKLLSMEGHKKVYCQYFLKRSREISLDNVVSCLRELEPRIRRSYSKNIELGVDEFIKVILVDCGFIIELLIRYYNFMETDHDIIRKPWLLEKIRYDLLLLENQIPFFVLEKLWDLAFQSSLFNGDNSLSLLELASCYLCPTERIVFESSIRVAHFTDMNRIFCLKPFKRNLLRTNEVPTLHYSASELHEAGVKFKVNREEKSLLELKFSGKCLQVPEIEVDDGTETWFRNMVALEQCHYLEESYITDYVIFIGHLVNEGKDVDVLVKNKIIVNRLGFSEALGEISW
ncbi:hypothetical protein PIB30_079527 [Stylosanthes scabra]|uniref:Uncharacterized protein n=1 Tax=Stylosanthes scabra TaxID=79078 RepID=A0ABU6SS00_9FABA|nr:hypothetical protein [Stylosanthes scabra]